MKNYIIYDVETSGLSPEYDQILQFAALVTDENLQEIPESCIDIRCNLAPHIIPSPKALAVTNISPDLLHNQTMDHRAFMHYIQEWCTNWKPAIFMGYNSINFDERMMRQGFYQTLHSPYLTNTGGNARGDIMKIVHAVAIFKPSLINIPMSNRGKPQFKLGKTAAANGVEFDEADAHDALYDVRKTVELASYVKSHAPGIWEFMLRNINKSSVHTLFETNEVIAAAEMYFNKPYRWLVSKCGVNPNYNAEIAVFDLSYNPSEYLSLSADEILNLLNAKEKPIRIIRANNQPFVTTLELVDKEYLKHVKVSEQEAITRSAIIAEDGAFQARVSEALSLRYEDKDAPEQIEEKIYSGFPSHHDENLMEKFHKSPSERSQNFDTFEDARYKQLARRLLYLHEPNSIPKVLKQQMDKWLAERLLTTADVPWRSLACAKDELLQLKTEGIQNSDLIKKIENYFDQKTSHLLKIC